jgi:hypothetical protein
MVVVGLLAVPVVAQPAFIIVQDAQTTGDGTAIDRRGAPTFTFFVEWSAGTSAGVITIEEAADATYTGTWSSLATVTWAVADSTEAVHLGPAPYGAIRARISTTVTGGTVTVRVRGIQ